MGKKMELAVYGKGGIGKSTVSANLTAALALAGERVLQIGCDPKHDSTRLLMHGENIPTVLEYLRDTPRELERPSAVVRTGFRGTGCIEAGGPKPGVGCAGRGIISAFEFLNRHRVKEQYDTVVYDVLGDVVCGGFAVPVRREYANAIFLVTSGEYMALYAANNILRGIRNFDGDTYRRVAGIIYNERRLPDEDGRVERFARAVGLPICAKVPRSEAFARAEEQNVTVMELEGFEREKTVFRILAGQIQRGLGLWPARPLSDDELEQAVLETSVMQGNSEKQGDLAMQRNSPADFTNAGNTSDTNAYDGNASDWNESDRKASDSNLSDGNEADGNVADGNASDRNIAGRDAETKASTKRPPLYGCAFNGAAVTAVHLTDALVLAHSPRACAFYTWQTISSPGRKNLFNRGILMPSAISPNFACTDMGQAEAVFGGTDKLRQKIQELQARRPGAIVVISSCVSGIIGDDIQDCESLSTDETPVIAIAADGDIAGDYMEGIRLVTYALAERLIDPQVQPEGRLVNIVNEVSCSYNNELNYRILRDLLGELGIGINCRFLGDATTEEVRHFLRAEVNILADDGEDGQKLKQWLIDRYHCRFLEDGFPVGFRATASFLRNLGAIFHCEQEAEQIIDREEQRLRQRIEALREQLAGRTILLTTINTNLDWLIEAAHDAGMHFAWIGVVNYLHRELNITEHPEYCGEITEEVDWGKIGEQAERLHPDIVLSNYTATLDEGLYLTDALPMTPVAGFDSALGILERWAALLSQENQGQQQGSQGQQKGNQGQQQWEGGWKNDRTYFEKYYG